MTRAQERIGEQIGEYRLQTYLGRGSFGTVYLATHVHTQAQVAIKLLNTPLTNSEEWQAFLNEARSIRLQHPHIMPLLDFGVSHEEMPFLVMEYAAGGTLRALVKQETRLPLAAVATYTQQLASALQYAHNRRLIHRDVKPENMLLRADGTILLSDFGISRILEQSSTLSNLTHAGTPAYMAPEQGQGRPCPASDQYALAVVVYEWITGRRPFLGSPIEVAIQHRLEEPPPLRRLYPGASLEMEQVLHRALAKMPEARFENVARFAQELQQTIQTIEANRSAAVESLPPPTWKLAEAAPNTPVLSAMTVTQDDEVEEETWRAPATSKKVEAVHIPPEQSQPAQVQASLTPPGPAPRVQKQPRRLPLAWLIGLIVLITIILTGSGTWYLASRQTQQAHAPQSSAPLTSGHLSPVTTSQAGATPSPATTSQANTTPSPTIPASVAAVPAGWHQILNDPMTASKHSSPWSISPGCAFIANAYQQSDTGSNYCSYGDSSDPTTVFTDLSYSLDILIHQGKQSGLIIRNHENHYYYFSFTTTGTYVLLSHTSANGGDDTPIASGTSSAIHQGTGQWNRLTIVARGSSLALFINGTSLGTYTDSTYSHGVIGVGVNGPALQNVTDISWFRNAEVYVP